MSSSFVPALVEPRPSDSMAFRASLRAGTNTNRSSGGGVSFNKGFDANRPVGVSDTGGDYRLMTEEMGEETGEEKDLTAIVTADYYLTRAAPGSRDLDFDAWSNMGAVYRFGRPDLRAVLRTIRYEVGLDVPVAVLACGPKGMVEELRGLCQEMSGSTRARNRFDFHSETFDF